MSRRFPALPLLLLAAVPLQACVQTAIGAGAVIGTAALDERGVDGVAIDTALNARIRGKLLDYDLETGKTLAVDVGVEVHEGRALLTGFVADEEQRAVAVRKAWEVTDIKQVYNEIAIGGGGVKDTARDSWITTQLRTAITLDREISAVNYEIETTGSVIYLIGVAQSREELGRVINHAREISRVRDVVSHVRIKTGAGKPADGKSS